MGPGATRRHQCFWMVSFSSPAPGSAVVVDEATIDAIAARVVAVLRAGGWTSRLVDAAELARRHGVSRSFVYDHAEELGAIRLGSGARARLRFDPQFAFSALASKEEPQPRPPNQRVAS